MKLFPDVPILQQYYCGPPRADLLQILGYGRAGDSVISRFDSDKTYYVHKARTGIGYTCEVMKIGCGDEVLTPAYNCGSEIDPVFKTGAKVVLYRVGRDALADTDDLKKKVTGKTRAIYVTHYFGFPQPLGDIQALCRQKGLFLIEDCALSLFSSDGRRPLGSAGDFAVFSFPKTLPVPDGGALVINNADLVPDRWRLRRPPAGKVMRNMLPLLKRFVLDRASRCRCLYPVLWRALRKREPAMDQGGRMDRPDMPPDFYWDDRLQNKAISGITRRMLATFEVGMIIHHRRGNFAKYLELLSHVAGVEPLYRSLPDGVCPLYFPVIVSRREEICRTLKAWSVDAIAWWAGYHRSLPWEEYPDACFLKDNVLVLPVHQDLDNRHVEFIAHHLREAVHSP